MSQGLGLSHASIPPLAPVPAPSSSPPGMSQVPRCPPTAFWDRGVWPHGDMAAGDGWPMWHLVGRLLPRVPKSDGAGDSGQNLKSDGGFTIHHGHSACSCSVSIALLLPVPMGNHHPTYKTLPWPVKGLLGVASPPHWPTACPSLLGDQNHQTRFCLVCKSSTHLWALSGKGFFVALKG